MAGGLERHSHLMLLTWHPEDFLKGIEGTRTSRALHSLFKLSGHSRAHKSKHRILQVSVTSRVRQEGLCPLPSEDIPEMHSSKQAESFRGFFLGGVGVVAGEAQRFGWVSLHRTKHKTGTAHLGLRTRWLDVNKVWGRLCGSKAGK